ncbi:extracellular solute-binding protein [Cellulomonas shaoxiangyii]|uniref:Extracellular solute-binding protein n=1 Tax=Cellulomonas shaoxiangyii TaxID=2566013 RepID=A0A4P7SGJ8_9CELL|nr:extracellular solute-binding protein [Cellulomonas shaoxiangyii]QCB92791.1 extracellular solute-binding protein [Cellulomonas shaoxiangyii]TGY78397.1 extracellular solute-binding protein [Cellulomonas shaoxiangyii]
MTRAGINGGRRPRTTRAAAAVAAGLALTLAACSGGGGDGGDATEEQRTGAMEGYAAGDQFTASEPLELSILWTDWPEVTVKDEWQFFDLLKEQTNVTLETTHIPLSDHLEKRSLLISAGDAPDIIPLVYTGEEEQFAASGAVVPLSKYLDEMPHFQKYVEEWDLQEMVDNLRQEDGELYMLPGFQEVSVPMFTLLVRKDKFDELGIEMPDTWEDFREAFVKLKEAYPDSYPLQDGFQGNSLLNYAARGFGTQAGWGFGDGMQWDEEKGEFEYAATSEEYKEMVEYFHGLVQDGLFDPDSFTVQDQEAVERVERLISEGKAFAGSGASGTAIEWGQALDATVGPGNHEVVQIPPPAGPAGALVEPRNFWHGFMITKDAESKPYFTALLQFLDWMYYSPEARDMLRWGVEGETYTKSGDEYTLDAEHRLDTFNLNPGAPTDIQKDLGFSTFLAEATESRALKESYSTDQAVEYIDAVLSTRTPTDPLPPAPLSEADLEQASLLGTPLKDSVDTATLRFILGERPLSEWDAFVAELESKGLQQYVDLYNGARERFAESNG